MVCLLGFGFECCGGLVDLLRFFCVWLLSVRGIVSRVSVLVWLWVAVCFPVGFRCGWCLGCLVWW